MRAALYVRVSSVGQARDGYSLEFQEQILREFCQREGHQIVEIYKDGGASGSNTQRKDLVRLIADAGQLRFDMVLIFRVDRFSRDPIDLLALVRQLETSKIKLRSVTEAIDASDPSGELMLTILGAIGKFVRANIIQNAMLGKTKRAESGKFTGGKVPFGYVVGEDERYVPDREPWSGGLSKADVVRRAFELYVESAQVGRPGTEYVCRWMEMNGVSSPDGHTWAKSVITQWFRHPVYMGTFVYARRSQPMGKKGNANPRSKWIEVEDNHEAIVPPELYNQVQILKADNRRGGGVFPEVPTGLLTGFAICAECECNLSLRRGAKNAQGEYIYYYTCGSRVNDSRRRRGETCVTFPFLRGEKLEGFIWNQIEQAVEDPTTIRDLLSVLSADAGPQLEAGTQEIIVVRKRLSDIESEEMKVTTAYAQGKLPAHIWEKQIQRLEQDRERLRIEMRTITDRIETLKRHPALTLSPEQIQNYLRKIFRQESMTHEERRQALGLLLRGKGIRVSKDGSVKISLVLPLSEVACSIDDMATLAVATRPNC